MRLLTINLLLIAVMLPSLCWALEPVGELEPVEYVRTIDGDTIVVMRSGDEEHVRLFGIDAPELREGTAEAFRSALGLADWLEQADTVYLETDPVALIDSFDRTLGWVWFTTEDAAPRLANVELVAEGLAGVYPWCQSERYVDAFRVEAECE